MSRLEFSSKIISKNKFNKLNNNNFNQLILPNNDDDILNIDDFFVLYDDIFNQIPKEGDINSHRFILNKTSEYLGLKLSEENDIQLLLDEITYLREELLTINKSLSNTTNG